MKRPGTFNATPGWRVPEAIRALYRGRHGLPENHPLVVAAGQNGRLNGLGRRSMEVGERLDWNRDRGRYLTRKQAQQRLDVYRSSIESLNARLPEALPLPPDLESRGFEARSIMPAAAQIPRAELHAFYDELWSLLAKGAATFPGEAAAIGRHQTHLPKFRERDQAIR